MFLLEDGWLYTLLAKAYPCACAPYTQTHIPALSVPTHKCIFHQIWVNMHCCGSSTQHVKHVPLDPSKWSWLCAVVMRTTWWMLLMDLAISRHHWNDHGCAQWWWEQSDESCWWTCPPGYLKTPLKWSWLCAVVMRATWWKLLVDLSS